MRRAGGRVMRVWGRAWVGRVLAAAGSPGLFPADAAAAAAAAGRLRVSQLLHRAAAAAAAASCDSSTAALSGAACALG